jgi:hypothetical protein
MATIKDLAQEYAVYIKLNRDNPEVVSEISNRVKGLTYTSSGRSISERDKKELLDEIERLLSGRHPNEDGYYIVEAEDSSDLLRLINSIRNKS